MISILDSKADAVADLRMRRNVLPAVYNLQKSDGRNTQDSVLLTAREYNSALESGFTDMNLRFVIKKEAFCSEISTLRKRIVDYNLHGIEGLDDSDIDFLEDEVDECDSDNDSDIEFEVLFPRPNEVIVKTEDDIAEPVNNDNDENEIQGNNSVDSQNIAQSDEVSLAQVHSNDDDNQASSTSATTVAENVNETNDENININVLSGDMEVIVSPVQDYVFPQYETAIRKRSNAHRLEYHISIQHTFL